MTASKGRKEREEKKWESWLRWAKLLSDKIDGKLCVTIGEKLNYVCAETVAVWLTGWDYYLAMMKLRIKWLAW